MIQNRSITGWPLEKKLYQLIFGRLDGGKIPVPQYQKRILRLVRNGIGGFVLFGGKKDEVRGFNAELQAVSEFPLLIASDIERGVGQQVEGCTLFPCQMAMAAATDRFNPNDVAILEEAIQAVAREAEHIGINMPLIPVLDVNKDPDNPIICTRAFSDDPEVVTWFGLLYIEILEKAGLVSCAKHFPGHGDTAVDSHLSLPVIRKSCEELISTDVMPFRAAVRHGVSSIMIGHLRVPAIDSLPASLSRKIHTMLRSALGFEGLILTDALTMKALDDIPDASVRCLNAGADILLHPADPDETVKALISAISSGKLDEERIDAALSRIIRRKETLRDAVTRDVDFHAHAALSSQVANKSVSLIKCTPGAVPLAEGEDVHIFMAGDRDPASMSPLRSLSPKVWMLSGQSNYPDLRNATTIVAIFTSIAAWRGNPGISRNEQERIRRIITSSRKSMVLSFGNPYVLRHFPESDALLAAYDATGETQKTIVRWLTEPGVLYGKIPVTFP